MDRIFFVTATEGFLSVTSALTLWQKIPRLINDLLNLLHNAEKIIRLSSKGRREGVCFAINFFGILNTFQTLGKLVCALHCVN